jgi:hypothetical protein
MTRTSWRPPADEQLAWFRPDSVLPARPSLVEFRMSVAAFVFGVSRALESLYFPLHELRAKLFAGELYLAAVPSAIAERDLEAHRRRMCDSALRFTRDLRAAWQRTRPEVEEYTRFFEGFHGDDLFRLRRVRANQWFAGVRAVVAPVALLLYEGIGQTPREDALAVLAEAREAVVEQGGAAFEAALARADFGDSGPSTPAPSRPAIVESRPPTPIDHILELLKP